MVETEDRRRATTHAALRTNHGACGVESRRARGGARRGVVLVTEYAVSYTHLTLPTKA